MYKNILVPVDGSPTGERGLVEAIGLARALGSRIRLVHIVNEMILASPDGVAVNIGPLLEALRASGRQVLDAADRAVRAAGIETDNVLVEEIGNQAGPAILQQAKEWPAELIVCGTHGRRGMRRIVLGSDAEYIVRQATIPVMLIRSAEGVR
jgi:nucleotide-binding universal stress UspA family protein